VLKKKCISNTERQTTVLKYLVSPKTETPLELDVYLYIWTSPESLVMLEEKKNGRKRRIKLKKEREEKKKQKEAEKKRKAEEW